MTRPKSGGFFVTEPTRLSEGHFEDLKPRFCDLGVYFNGENAP